jgi:Ni,Fe-hydrogenase I cytochrome b subunit
MTNIKRLKITMEFIHELSMFYVIPFIFIHFAGIFISEQTDGKGVASKMIAGE